MDTLTQITLGAAVGELALGKKVGNKAVLWGGIAGTIPDLDMLAAPLLDPVSRLAFHRGFSHSLTFLIFLAPLLAYLIYRIYHGKDATWREWTRLTLLALITHPLLDCFTSYGTQLFWPFSRYRVAWSTIFVIDPIYSLPFMLSVVLLLFYRRTSPKRRLINYLGLGFSTLYLAFTVVNKLYVTSVFERQLKDQHIVFQRILTSPTPFNNILWRGVAETKDGFRVGYFSLLDKGSDIRFDFTPANHQLIKNLEGDASIRTLMRITGGFYAIEKKGGALYFNDMRYGRLNGWGQVDGPFIFSFRISPPDRNTQQKLAVERVRPPIKINREIFISLCKRISGEEPGAF